MSELIKLDRIKVYRNYREHDHEDVAALALDMRANGYRESYPIELCPDGFGDYLIITGHGRHEAATLAGLDYVHALIFQDITAGDSNFMAKQLRENMARKQSSPLEDGLAFQAQIESGQTVADIARIISKAESWVSDRLSLAGCDPVLRSFAARHGIRYAIAASDLPGELLTPLIDKISKDPKKVNLEWWTELVRITREGWQESLQSDLFDADSFLVTEEWDTRLGQYVTDSAKAVAPKSETVRESPLSVEEVATMTGLSRATILKYLQRGVIVPDGRLGHTPYFYASSVETWQNERTIDTASKV